MVFGMVTTSDTADTAHVEWKGYEKRWTYRKAIGGISKNGKLP